MMEDKMNAFFNIQINEITKNLNRINENAVFWINSPNFWGKKREKIAIFLYTYKKHMKKKE